MLETTRTRVVRFVDGFLLNDSPGVDLACDTNRPSSLSFFIELFPMQAPFLLVPRHQRFFSIEIFRPSASSQMYLLLRPFLVSAPAGSSATWIVFLQLAENHSRFLKHSVVVDPLGKWFLVDAVALSIYFTFEHLQNRRTDSHRESISVVAVVSGHPSTSPQHTSLTSARLFQG